MFSLRLDNEIELVLLEKRHAKRFIKIVDENRSYLREWLSWLDRVTTENEAEVFLDQKMQQFARQDGFFSGIFYQGELIGMIGLYEINQANQSTYLGY